MSEELEVLKLVTHKLNHAKINYMISGSIAVNYYAIPRMTRDIDIVIEFNLSDINRFIELFQDDFYLDDEVIKTEIPRKGMFNLIHKDYLIKIDFIVKKSSKFKDTEFSRRKKIIIQDNPMWIVTPEDLILAKLDWARDSHSEMQLKDIQNIINTVNDLDWAYINHWINSLGFDTIFKELKR